MAASFPAMMWLWLSFGLLQATDAYVATFVDQFTGAGRPHHVGLAVWQGIHFAVVAEVPFLLVVPAAYSVADAANMTFAFALRGPATRGSSRC